MQVTFDIPDAFAAELTAAGKDPARVALEALALDGYRNGQLSDAAVRRLLGFETRLEVHVFLDDHDVPLNYTLEDWQHDKQAADRQTGEHPSGSEAIGRLMIVVADTSPINYLVLIGHIDVLPLLYQRVLIPMAVQQELQRSKTPQIVKDWLAAPPDWLEIRSIATPSDPSLKDLDSGEAEAISLAEQIHADKIIMDETFGRRVAHSHGLQVIGTLGILREAVNRNILNLQEAIGLLPEEPVPNIAGNHR